MASDLTRVLLVSAGILGFSLFASESPDAWNGTAIKPNPSLKTPDNKSVIEVKTRYGAEELQWPPFIVYPIRQDRLQIGDKVRISFYAKTTRPMNVSVGVTEHAPDSGRYTDMKTVALGLDWVNIVFEDEVKDVFGGVTADAPRISLREMKSSDTVYLGPLTLSIDSSQRKAIWEPAIACQRPGVWKAMEFDSLYVKSGTALDLSKILPSRPAGSHGRATVNSKGELVFSGEPDKPQRFLTLVHIPWSWPDPLSKEALADNASAIARQGYNMIRFHFLENIINGSGLKGPAVKVQGKYVLPERSEDIVLIPEWLDAFDYYVAELKKNGVYINLDAMSTFVGYDNGQNSPYQSQGAYTTKYQMFINPVFRNNWRAGVRKLLTHVNPYTEFALKDDPALVVVGFLNEQEILTEERDYSVEFKPAWIAFLKKKYPNYEALRTAWGGKCGDSELPSGGSFESLPGITHKVASGSSQAGLDMARCIADMEVEVTEFFLKTIKDEIGYTGLVTNWNMRTRLATVPARSLLSVISMNTYHAHPDGNQAINQNSALAEGGTSFKHLADARFIDRPFMNTELGIVFHNPYRHEQGALFGAGAAFQSWTALSCFSMPVEPVIKPMRVFATGFDPIIRASEVLSFFAYRRGDVKSANGLVEIALTDKFIFSGQGLRAVSDELSRLWAITGLGISYGKKRADVKPTLVVAPSSTSAIGGTEMFSTVESSLTTNDIQPVVTRLRTLKALSSDNLTDPANGLYQSDTGEILLDTKNGGELTVTTNRLAIAVMKKDHPVTAGPFSLSKCSVPASVSLASIDGDRPIAGSKRMLMMIATDALNNNMRFSEDFTRIVDNMKGTLPILMRTGQFNISVALEFVPASAKLYALRLDGERVEEIPVPINGKTLSVDLDTAKLKHGPTPFFELLVE